PVLAEAGQQPGHRREGGVAGGPVGGVGAGQAGDGLGHHERQVDVGGAGDEVVGGGGGGRQRGEVAVAAEGPQERAGSAGVGPHGGVEGDGGGVAQAEQVEGLGHLGRRRGEQQVAGAGRHRVAQPPVGQL